MTESSIKISEAYGYLMQIRSAEQRIRLKKLRRDALEGCLLPKAITYDGDRVQISPDDVMGEVTSQIADLDKEIMQMERDKARLIADVSDTIGKLDDEAEQLVLMGYYVANEQMQTVANEIVHYSLRWTFELRKKAVRHLAEILH